MNKEENETFMIDILYCLKNEYNVDKIIMIENYINDLKHQLEVSEQKIQKAIEYINNNTEYFDSEYVKIYGELCDTIGAKNDRYAVVDANALLKILGVDNET